MSQSENEVTLKNQYNNVSVKKSLIYQRIIHSITRGKHKDIVNEEYNWEQQQHYYSTEKQILRKIAALTQAHNYDNLTKDMIIQGLENYQIHSNEEKLQKGLEPILDCYLHEMNDADKNISVEFIDTSFRDYLVSEYYIESIFEGKPYYLCQGIPTKEVLEFLDGLLELFNTQEKDKELEIFLKSLHSYNEKIRELSNLYNENIRELSKQDVKAKLLENSRSFFRDEEIILRTYTQSNYQDKIWYTSKFPYTRYGELSIHRWLSLYTLIRLDPHTEFDAKSLERLIKSTSHNIPPHLKKLSKINLSRSDLSKADLSGADLSGARLNGADLSHADLSRADLSHADLSETDLTDTRFIYAILSKADLSGADFKGVNKNDVSRFYV